MERGPPAHGWADQRRTLARLICRFRVHRGRKGEPNGFTWQDSRDLIVRAHTQLEGPIVLVRDNLRTRLMPQMKELIPANEDWLTVFHFPSYAPDLNPQEGVWSVANGTIGNLAAANLDQLVAAVKRSLEKTQYRPHLIDGCLSRSTWGSSWTFMSMDMRRSTTWSAQVHCTTSR
ncbi:transposase [Streptomyces sp. JV185]|nr:transposase [Streptomyces sp. JV185]MEE1767972.1 transposase [Streptomyces sp. JV185]